MEQFSRLRRVGGLIAARAGRCTRAGVESERTLARRCRAARNGSKGMRNPDERTLMKCVISVLGKDRSGIVAGVSVVLAECGANIDDISQTILGEIFSMTMLVTLDPEVADFNTVQERLSKKGEELGVQITLQREDVFQFMYKI
jgi:ACT domain-containing protein